MKTALKCIFATFALFWVQTVYGQEQRPVFEVSAMSTIPQYELEEGAVITITSPVKGETYQWFLNGELIPNANEATYSIQKVELAHAGLYSCKVDGQLIETMLSLKVSNLTPNAIKQAILKNDYADLINQKLSRQDNLPELSEQSLTLDGVEGQLSTDKLVQKWNRQTEKRRAAILDKLNKKDLKLDKQLLKANYQQQDLLKKPDGAGELERLNQEIADLEAQKQTLSSKMDFFQPEVNLSEQIDINERLTDLTKTKGIREMVSQETPDHKDLLLRNTPPVGDRLFYEGVIGFSRDDANILNFSSLAGLQLNKRFSVGLGAGYQRATNIDNPLNGLWNANMMGRVNLIKGAYLNIENQIPILDDQRLNNFDLPNANKFQMSQLVGLGWRFPDKTKLPLHLRVMYRLASPESIFKSQNPLNFLIGLQF